jgi:hypothetical protein
VPRRPQRFTNATPPLTTMSQKLIEVDPRQGLILAVLGESHLPIFSQKLSFASMLPDIMIAGK